MAMRYLVTWLSGWDADQELPTYGSAVCCTERQAKLLGRREGNWQGWAQVEEQERGRYHWETLREWRLDGVDSKWERWRHDE